jgi:hypothetical protein
MTSMATRPMTAAVPADTIEAEDFSGRSDGSAMVDNEHVPSAHRQIRKLSYHLHDWKM